MANYILLMTLSENGKKDLLDDPNAVVTAHAEMDAAEAREHILLVALFATCRPRDGPTTVLEVRNPLGRVPIASGYRPDFPLTSVRDGFQ